MIYLDYAATTLKKPPEVIRAVCHAMQHMGNSGRGAHSDSLDASREIYRARRRLAALFGCPRADHVVFTSNASEALNIAIFGLFGPGDHVISSDLEHNSVLRPLYALEKRGTSADFLRADKKGCLDYDELSALLRPETKAVVITHASNLTGNLTDIARVGRFCREHGLLFILDASQTAGSLPIDMEKDGIDVLCFTGHKSLMGPQGTGGLCLRKDLDIKPLKCGGSGVQSYLKEQPHELPTRLEAGTLNGHGIAGLSAAVDFIEKTGIEKIHAHEMHLMRMFYEEAKKIPGIKIYGDFTGDRAPIVSLNCRDLSSGEAADILSRDYGIAVRAGAHCAPRMHQALGTVKQGAIRFSFGFYNTEDEVTRALDALRSL